MYEQLEILYLDRPELQRRKKAYATYSVEWLTLAASANLQQPAAPLLISDGYDFVWLLSTASVHDATFANTITNNPFNVTITDTSVSQLVTDRPAAFNNIFGTAQLPLVLPYPRIIAGNAGLTIALTNLIATAFNVQVTLHGFKLY